MSALCTLRLFLEVRGGPLSFERAAVEPGGRLRVGRTPLADFVVPHDERLAQVHFELRWDGAHGELKDVSGDRGTLLGGLPVDHAPVRSGAWIRAGASDFQVYVEHPGQALPEAAHTWPGGWASLARAAAEQRLFAVLDAAADDRVVPWLTGAADEHRSLYEGLQAETMADAAPYLVRFAPRSRLLPRLLGEGWGESLGVFVETAATFRDLRAHLRRLLVVTREADRLPMYFRFYDPRVLRAFLPLATRRQEELFFGPIAAFAAESRRGAELHRFTRGASGVELTSVEHGPGRPR